LGVVLSCVGYVAIQESAARDVANLVVNILGIAALGLTAAMLDWHDEDRRTAVPAPAIGIRRPSGTASEPVDDRKCS
jgi:hypothetical protein